MPGLNSNFNILSGHPLETHMMRFKTDVKFLRCHNLKEPILQVFGENSRFFLIVASVSFMLSLHFLNSPTSQNEIVFRAT